MYRLAHAKTEFVAPKPFEIIGVTRHLNILGGDNANITFKSNGEPPDSIFIEFKPLFNTQNKDSLIIFTAQKSNNNEYRFQFLKIYQNFQYRAYSPKSSWS